MALTRDERDRFVAATPDDISYGEGACLETPPSVFAHLHERFAFDIDLTASEQNHLLPTWFGPGSIFTDALTAPWRITAGHPGAGFSNPPYGPFIPKILKKAIEERAKGFTSVFLLPNRAGGWFQDYVIPAYSELWYCSERINFFYQGKPRLSARVKVTPKWKRDPRVKAVGTEVWTTEPMELTYRVYEQDYTYQFEAEEPLMAPAGALFDSIIVVYRPSPLRQPVNVFEVKTGKLRY